MHLNECSPSQKIFLSISYVYKIIYTILKVIMLKKSLALPNSTVNLTKQGYRPAPTRLLYPSIWILITLFLFAGYRYSEAMNTFEVLIFISSSLILLFLSHRWQEFRWASITVGVLSLFALWQYQGDLNSSQSQFFLKYLFSSQSAIMWMSALFILATMVYFIHMFSTTVFIALISNRLSWIAVVMGFVGLLVRWHESYLLDPAIGYIPVSNLYEVFILFCLMTALIYLYTEKRINNYKLGFFVLLIISSAVAFLLWYTFEREAHHIRPLVPALNSYWMKIHVPANFIAYGAFAVASMSSMAWLIINKLQQQAIVASWVKNMPSIRMVDEITYRCISLGFIAFTIATILGALWAAEAWGGYWSWDPKETWALIVWLNYAAWLHLRISKGWRGNVMAWWSIIGLFVTLFAFLGVNMFLSGLHSYGEL